MWDKNNSLTIHKSITIKNKPMDTPTLTKLVAALGRNIIE